VDEQLPDLPANAALIDFLRAQAAWPTGRDDYVLGDWQLHAHPDLLDRLSELAPGWPLTAAYGVPILARDGVAAVVALGTGYLAVRIEYLPPGVEPLEADPAWSVAGDGWHFVSPWPNQLPAADGTRLLRELVAAALSRAGSLAGKGARN
jgi:hypothetical protein